jgi:hypothetical protein
VGCIWGGFGRGGSGSGKVWERLGGVGLLGGRVLCGGEGVRVGEGKE